MNDHVTISLVQLFEMFPDNESAQRYLESRLWPQGVRCPDCKHGERVTTRKGGYYRCNPCRLDFTVRTGTIFERSHVPLHKWLYAMYMLVTARKGISSLQLAKELGVTQKSAWFMLHRLREAIGKDLEKLRGAVEIDETLAMPIESTSIPDIQTAIHRHVAVGSTLYTDEYAAYNNLDGLFFKHERVNHSANEYVKGMASTNSIESVWAVFKRGLKGVYHQTSKKHLKRYINEFVFRLNAGNVKRHTLERLNSFIDTTVGTRITYAGLTA